MQLKFVKPIALILCFLLVFEQSGLAQTVSVDISGYLTGLHQALTVDKFRPLHLRYLSYDNQTNNFKLLIDKGDYLKGLSPPSVLQDSKGTVPLEIAHEARKLMEYFYVGLALPNDTFWVNLRPEEKRGQASFLQEEKDLREKQPVPFSDIIDPLLAQTDIGRIMLETDVQLKKDTARMTSPETPEGRRYWDKLYKKAEELFGTQQITIPTLTRPWIVPNEIIIRESSDNAYIYKATLKVMLEEDYLKSNQKPVTRNQNYEFKDERLKLLNEYSTELIRELILPKLTKEINTSKRYASLRQVYYSLILAQWFKSRFASLSLRGSAAGADEAIFKRINSCDLTSLKSKEPWQVQTYFQAYQKSFQDGEYNIKENCWGVNGQQIKTYFSGGIGMGGEIRAAIDSGLSLESNRLNPPHISGGQAFEMQAGTPAQPIGKLTPGDSPTVSAVGGSAYGGNPEPSPGQQLIREEIDTGQTVDVGGLERWTEERILIDIAQNHCDETRLKKAELWSMGLKDESSALKPAIIFILKDGSRLNLQEAKNRGLTHRQVAAIVLSDNGDGYDSRMLKYRLSHGKTEAQIPPKILSAFQEGKIDMPGGQFGEGQKMLAASILKKRLEQQMAGTADTAQLGLIYRSRGWQAVLFGKPVEIQNRETIRTNSVAFMTSAAGQNIKGSETILENPTEELLKAALNIDELVLDFAPSLRITAKSNRGAAIEYKEGSQALIYVRGYRICSVLELYAGRRELLLPLFSYNLANAEVNRDRDRLQADIIKDIGDILLFGASLETMKRIFTFAVENPLFYRYSGGGGTYGNQEMLESKALDSAWYQNQGIGQPYWCQAFYEHFGEDALLASSSRVGSRFENESTQSAVEHGRKVVVLNFDLVSFLAHIGVKTDDEYSRKTIETYKLGLALDYEKERWGQLRIVLDFLQNHTDEARDFSHQNQKKALARVEFQINGEDRWRSWTEMVSYKNNEIAAVRFSDDSPRGYAHAHLQQLGSKKRESDSVQTGQFGEGLKMASAASLRLGFDVSLGSRDWIAEAFSYDSPVENGKRFSNLGYKVVQAMPQAGSETIIRYTGKRLVENGDARDNFNALLNVVRDLQRLVLCHREAGLAEQDPEPLISTVNGDIISAQQGDIYVKYFFITSEERERLIFGYNFMRLETNRDRNIVSPNQLDQEVREILSSLQDKGLIKRVISLAVNAPDAKYHEFQDISGLAGFQQNKELWAEVFRKLYGQDAVLKSKQDKTAVEAEFMGYRVINVNGKIGGVLHAAGIRYDYEVISPKFDYLTEEQLTGQERNVLEAARLLDEGAIVFPGSMPTEYRVFQEAVNSIDRRPMPGVMGYSDPKGRFIAFKRRALNDPVEFIKVYAEEKAHQISGAGDGSREHVEQFHNAIVWLLRLKQNAQKANAILAEVFPGFSVEDLEPRVVNGAGGEVDIVLELSKLGDGSAVDSEPSPAQAENRPQEVKFLPVWKIAAPVKIARGPQELHSFNPFTVTIIELLAYVLNILSEGEGLDYDTRRAFRERSFSDEDLEQAWRAAQLPEEKKAQMFELVRQIRDLEKDVAIIMAGLGEIFKIDPALQNRWERQAGQRILAFKAAVQSGRNEGESLRGFQDRLETRFSRIIELSRSLLSEMNDSRYTEEFRKTVFEPVSRKIEDIALRYRKNSPGDSSGAGEENKGGIDMRHLPIVTQAAPDIMPGIFRDSNCDMSLDLETEWLGIQRLISAGIAPSSERIREYIAVSYAKGRFEKDADKVLDCIAEILRKEEESLDPTRQMLKDILVWIEAGCRHG